MYQSDVVFVHLIDEQYGICYFWPDFDFWPHPEYITSGLHE